MTLIPPEERTEPYNEFVPEGEINLQCSSYLIKNVLCISKIDPSKEFSFDIDKIKYEVAIIPQETNPYLYLSQLGNWGGRSGGYSIQYPINFGGDDRYGAVGNTTYQGKNF